MAGKKYTIEEIRNDPELKGQVCSRADDQKTSGGGGIMDMIFDGIGAGIDAGFDAIDKGIDAGFDAIDTAMGGTSDNDDDDDDDE